MPELAAASSAVELPFAAGVAAVVAASPAADSGVVAGPVAGPAVGPAVAVAAVVAAAVGEVDLAGEVPAAQELEPGPAVGVAVVTGSAAVCGVGSAAVLERPVLHVQAELEAAASSVQAVPAALAGLAVLPAGSDYSAGKRRAAWLCGVAP